MEKYRGSAPNIRKVWELAAIAILLLAGGTAANADTLAKRQNLTDLIRQADVIVHGDVVSVTDGFDNNIPYTEVKVRVKEMLRGSAAETITFRQFGLIKPRNMPNGLVNYSVTPVDWAIYKPREEVVLFLHKPARMTGLRTTVGLGQGKFTMQAGRIVSQQQNRGLFDDVTVEPSLLNKSERQMFATAGGAVNAQAFLTFVRRAVQDQWVETGKMRNAK